MDNLPQPTKEAMFKVTLNFVIAGFLYQGGEVEDAILYLRDVAKDYEDRWKEETK